MFKRNKILSETENLANEFHQARKDKKLKLKEIASEINIDLSYLKALENGEYHKLPEGVYRKNLIKEYAIFLGLDEKKILENLGEQLNSQPKTEKDFFSKQVIKSHKFLIVPKIIRSVIIITIVLVCFTYLGFYLKNIVAPPELNITSPQDNIVISDNFINIIGQTEEGAELSINGEFITSSTDGLFFKKINLKEGINTITIVAKKKYSRERIVKRQILVE